MRGRDIKRYSHDFADLYLIATFPSLKIDIEAYPAVKNHLLSFGYDRLRQTGDKNARKKTNNKWYETQDSISYWEDFSKQKILWAETMRIHKNTEERFPRFGLDLSGDLITDKTCFFASGKDIKFILAVLNSSVGKYLCSQYVSILDDGGYLMQKIYIEKIPIPNPDTSIRLLIEEKLNSIGTKESYIDDILFKLFDLAIDEIEFIKSL